jgi:apolipoprotein N-acyltransferase
MTRKRITGQVGEPADNRTVRVRSALRRTGRWIWSVRRLMLLAGALLVLTFPDANLEFLAWFGLVPGLVLIVRSPTAREGGIRAWWLGAGYLIAALYWLAPEIGPGVLGLPAASARTIYDRLGDYVPWSAVGVTLLAALVMFANSRGFPGRNAGIKREHEAQYVAGQSVPS